MISVKMTKQDVITDEQLMLRVAQGDRTAYGMLVQSHAASFTSFAVRLTGSRHEAEDILQDAFLRLWKASERWDPAKGAKFTTWFYRIVMNLCLDHKKKYRPTEDVDKIYDLASGEKTAEMNLADQQRVATIHLALDQLPERKRTILVLTYVQGLSNHEAAEIMRVSVSAVESLLVRARRDLADILQDEKSDLLEETQW